MSNVMVPPILGMAQTNGQWTAWSAIGTGAAAIIALFLPVVTMRLAARAEKQKTQARYHEVASATLDSLDIVIAMKSAWAKGDHAKCRRHAAKAVATAEAIRLLVAAPGLTDGLIVSAAAAANALGAVSRAGLIVGDLGKSIPGSAAHASNQKEDMRNAIGAELAAALDLAHEADERIRLVITKWSIPVRAGKTLPQLPPRI